MHSHDMTLRCFSSMSQSNLIIIARSLSMNCDNGFNSVAFDTFVLFIVDERLIPGIFHQ